MPGKYRKVTLGIIIAILVLAGVMIARHRLVTPPVSVETITLSKGEFITSIFARGSIIPAQKVDISPKIMGEVQEIAQEGQPVQKGQLIAKLGQAELLAKLDQAKTALRQAQINFKNAKENLATTEELYAKDAIAKKELCMAKTQYEIAEAQLQSSQAGLNYIKTQLAGAQIQAPIPGMVAHRYAQVGEMAVPGKPILTIVDLSKVLVAVNVDNADIGKVKVGQKAKVSVDAFPGDAFEGEVIKVAKTAKSGLLGIRAESPTFETVIELAPGSFEFKPGMLVDSEIEVLHHKDVLYVPLEAIVMKGTREGVFVVSEDQAFFREVKTGPSSDTDIEILEGLEPGQRIVANALGLEPLAQLERVTIREELKRK